jgi:hypothetical protein
MSNEEKAKRELETIAKETLSIELPYDNLSCIYAFGSELACLRLYQKYVSCATSKEKTDCYRFAYSENKKSFFFRIDNTWLFGGKK